MELKHYKELDGIRAIAALMVMFFHFFEYVASNGNKLVEFIIKVSLFGQTGVTLFFVLSGFLITRILLATKRNENYFKSFYVRRSLRIFPLYYLYLFLVFCVIPLFDHNFIPLRDNWYYLVYLQNFALTFNWRVFGPIHFWSLAVEEQFYLFWPLLVYFLNVKQITRLIYVIIILALVCRVVLFSIGYEFFYLTFSVMDALALGALIAVKEYRNTFSKSSNFYLIAFILLMIPICLIGFLVAGQKLVVVRFLKWSLYAFAFYLLIVYVIKIERPNLVKKILSSRPLTYLGKISYGLYVFHILGFYYPTLIYKFDSILLNLIFQFSFTILIATISYYLFENKFLKLKKYFQYSNKKAVKNPRDYSI